MSFWGMYFIMIFLSVGLTFVFCVMQRKVTYGMVVGFTLLSLIPIVNWFTGIIGGVIGIMFACCYVYESTFLSNEITEESFQKIISKFKGK